MNDALKMARPDCFDFAMDFLGGEEEKKLREYIESLEQQHAAIESLREELEDEHMRHVACGVVACPSRPQIAHLILWGFKT